MSFEVKTISVFDKQAKRLAKKYPALKEALKDLISDLKKDPRQGTPLGRDCYKIRLSLPGKKRGRSGGGRVITHVVFHYDTVYLLTIYDKSKTATVTDKEIKAFLKEIPSREKP